MDRVTQIQHSVHLNQTLTHFFPLGVVYLGEEDSGVDQNNRPKSTVEWFDCCEKAIRPWTDPNERSEPKNSVYFGLLAAFFAIYELLNWAMRHKLSLRTKLYHCGNCDLFWTLENKKNKTEIKQCLQLIIYILNNFFSVSPMFSVLEDFYTHSVKVCLPFF